MNYNLSSNSTSHDSFIAEVKYRLRYDPELGELVWERPRKHGLKPGSVAGYLPKSGYRFLKIGYDRYWVAQLIWLLHHGWYPRRVYRLDGNPRNTRIENLYV